jgi:hypothetical protein
VRAAIASILPECTNTVYGGPTPIHSAQGFPSEIK